MYAPGQYILTSIGIHSALASSNAHSASVAAASRAELMRSRTVAILPARSSLRALHDSTTLRVSVTSSRVVAHTEAAHGAGASGAANVAGATISAVLSSGLRTSRCRLERIHQIILMLLSGGGDGRTYPSNLIEWSSCAVSCLSKSNSK